MEGVRAIKKELISVKAHSQHFLSWTVTKWGMDVQYPPIEHLEQWGPDVAVPEAAATMQ